MVAAGLDGFELIWVAGSMMLLSFPYVDLRGRLVSSTEVWSTWFGRLEEWSASVVYESCRAWISISGLSIHLWLEGSFHNIVGLWGSYLRVDAATKEVVEISAHNRVFWIVVQEAELVQVPTVEQREVEASSELGDSSQGASVASPISYLAGEQDRVLSPCSYENQLWGLDRNGRDRTESVGVIIGVERSAGDCGGVRSASAVLDAIVGALSVECVAVVQAPESAVVRDSHLGHILGGDCAMSLGDNCVTSPPAVVLGDAEATLAPIIGSVPASVRKIKSVNSLVEALGSSAQWCVVHAARSRRGHGRPRKGICLVEAGGDVVNASLTDSDI
ncbi:hypothetical protein V6N12_016853 [Hibiscus sabdariffa]|uniref:Uncharacterized protein n=1 Tax=Hibiscus sabdariffa TaxID=183260 RepID=A0ABR2BPC3_9ROSI